MNKKPKVHPGLAILIVVVLVGIVASVAIVVNSEKEATKDSSVTGSANSSSANPSPETSTDTSTYKDGTYTATGSYLSPGGRELVDLTVVVKDGVITETSLVKKASDSEAEEYQEKFATNYQSQVVGKKINGLSLSRVAGSSLTSNGFNNALTKIRDQAKE